MNNEFDLENFANNNKILEVYSGSIAYGTNHANSDIDIRGIYLDNFNNILLNKRIEQINFKNEDTVFYELSNFLTNIKEQKPNALELVWVDPKHIRYVNELGQILIDNKEKFLSKKVINSYIGYARGELSRIKGHNKWINKPQEEHPPKKQNFFNVVWNLSENEKYNKTIPINGFCAVNLKDNHFALYENKDYSKNNSWFSNNESDNIITIEKNIIKEPNPVLIVKFNEKLYDDAKLNWKNYWTWKKHRNASRSEKEEMFGYDTKNAMHLVRLLKTGIEILETGKLNVFREDAEFLKSILNGKYKYNEIIDMSDNLINKIKLLEEKSSLPNEIDYKMIDSIILDIYNQKFSKKNNLTIK